MFDGVMILVLVLEHNLSTLEEQMDQNIETQEVVANSSVTMPGLEPPLEESGYGPAYIHTNKLHAYIPYSGKVWQEECLMNLLFSSIWQKKFGEWIDLPKC